MVRSSNDFQRINLGSAFTDSASSDLRSHHQGQERSLDACAQTSQTVSPCVCVYVCVCGYALSESLCIRRTGCGVDVCVDMCMCALTRCALWCGRVRVNVYVCSHSLCVHCSSCEGAAPPGHSTLKQSPTSWLFCKENASWCPAPLRHLCVCDEMLSHRGSS